MYFSFFKIQFCPTLHANFLLCRCVCFPSFAPKNHIVVMELVLVPSWYSLMFAQSEGLILLSKVAFRLCNNIISIALLLRGLFIIEKKLLRKKGYGFDP